MPQQNPPYWAERVVLVDKAGNPVDGAESYASHIAPVTPSDAADLPGGVTKGVAFATAGDIKVTTEAGETLVIPNGVLAAGIVHPARWTRIWSTGTLAANIFVWY